VALAEHQTGVVARGKAAARKIASRRSPTSCTSARSPAGSRSTPSSIARRIAAGSSERGLSSVTTRTSARRAATSPISGRLPRSRSPPQPSTTMTRPREPGRTAAIARSTASGVWA
jgi:hypothetical protein